MWLRPGSPSPKALAPWRLAGDRHQPPPRRFAAASRSYPSDYQNPRPKTSPLCRIAYRLSSTAPWILGWSRTHLRPSPKRPQSVLDCRDAVSSDEDEMGSSRSSGSGTMARIVEKLKKFGYIDDSSVDWNPMAGVIPERGSVEDIFYAEDGVIPDPRGGLSVDLNAKDPFSWEKPPPPLVSPRRKISTGLVAEQTLTEGERQRLRHLALMTKSKFKIKGRGVTDEIVHKIHETWATDEVVRVKCEGPLALDMKRMHEIIERKTGGLVIWRSGTSVLLYRGVTYGIPKPLEQKYSCKVSGNASEPGEAVRILNGDLMENDIEFDAVQDLCQHQGVPDEMKKDDKTSQSFMSYEQEMDDLLDGLGPRYTDWPGCDPLPVDADLIPGVTSYRCPFRLLPYGVSRSLRVKNATALRRLARALPPHFALGRSRQHEGLAAAMVKLWEKSSIAKIALKRGVQNNISERMSEDIKKLTGGTLLSRDKDYLVFYRGNDFLSPEVAEVLLERERLLKALMVKARQDD